MNILICILLYEFILNSLAKYIDHIVLQFIVIWIGLSMLINIVYYIESKR